MMQVKDLKQGKKTKCSLNVMTLISLYSTSTMLRHVRLPNVCPRIKAPELI